MQRQQQHNITRTPATHMVGLQQPDSFPSFERFDVEGEVEKIMERKVERRLALGLDITDAWLEQQEDKVRATVLMEAEQHRIAFHARQEFQMMHCFNSGVHAITSATTARMAQQTGFDPVPVGRMQPHPPATTPAELYSDPKTPGGVRDRFETVDLDTAGGTATEGTAPRAVESGEDDTTAEVLAEGRDWQRDDSSNQSGSGMVDLENTSSERSPPHLADAALDPYTTPAQKRNGAKTVKFRTQAPALPYLAVKDLNMQFGQSTNQSLSTSSGKRLSLRTPVSTSAAFRLSTSPATRLSTSPAIRLSTSPATSASKSHFIIILEKGPGNVETVHLPDDICIKPTGPNGPKNFIDSICMLPDGSVVGILEGFHGASDCWKVLVCNKTGKPEVGPFNPKGTLPDSTSTPANILAVQSVDKNLCVMMTELVQIYDYRKGRFSLCHEIPVKEGIRTASSLSPSGVFVALGKSGLFSFDPAERKIKVWTGNGEKEVGNFKDRVETGHTLDSETASLISGGLNQEIVFANGKGKCRVHFAKGNVDGTHDLGVVSTMKY
jgi:hypothetical protein